MPLMLWTFLFCPMLFTIGAKRGQRDSLDALLQRVERVPLTALINGTNR